MLVDQSDGFGVALLGFAKLAPVPVDAAQPEQQYALLDAIPRALGASLLIGCHGGSRVGQLQVEVAHGEIHLVEVVLVVLHACHAAQLAQHLAASRRIGGHDFGLQDAGVEGQVEGWALGNTFRQSLVGSLAPPQPVVHLAEQEEQASLALAARCGACGLFEPGQCFGIALLAQQEVSACGCRLALHAGGHGVAGHAGQGVFGIIVPADMGITAGEPLPGRVGHHGFGGIEPRDVGEGGSSFQEVALFKLRLAHEQPCVFQEGVILLALHELLGLGRVALAGFELWLFLYGV